VLDLSQTWNASGTTFTGLRLTITDTASATDSALFRIRIGTNERFIVNKAASGGTTTRVLAGEFFAGISDLGVATGSALTTFAVRARSDGNIGFVSGTDTTAGNDVTLRRDAANTLALQNGTNAQTFNIYNTHSSSTNHERLRLAWASNVAIIGTEKGSGGGTARALEFQTDGVTRMTVGTTGLIGIGAAPSTHLLNISGAVNSGFSAQLTNTGTNPEGWCILLPNMAVAASRAIFYGGTALTTRNGFGLNFVNVGAGSTSNRVAFSFNAVDDIFILRADRRAGINTTAPDRALEINDASGGCLRLTHNDNNGSATNFCDMTVASDGVTTIAPSGTELVVTKNLNLSTKDLVTDTTTGTKIGTATTQKVGFFNATPVVQQAAVADATDAASTQDRLNDLLARLRTLGLIAT
jgi:hypothetical protein